MVEFAKKYAETKSKVRRHVADLALVTAAAATSVTGGVDCARNHSAVNSALEGKGDVDARDWKPGQEARDYKDYPDKLPFNISRLDRDGKNNVQQVEFTLGSDLANFVLPSADNTPEAPTKKIKGGAWNPAGGFIAEANAWKSLARGGNPGGSTQLENVLAFVVAHKDDGVQVTVKIDNAALNPAEFGEKYRDALGDDAMNKAASVAGFIKNGSGFKTALIETLRKDRKDAGKSASTLAPLADEILQNNFHVEYVTTPVPLPNLYKIEGKDGETLVLHREPDNSFPAAWIAAKRKAADTLAAEGHPGARLLMETAQSADKFTGSSIPAEGRVVAR